MPDKEPQQNVEERHEEKKKELRTANQEFSVQRRRDELQGELGRAVTRALAEEKTPKRSSCLVPHVDRPCPRTFAEREVSGYGSTRSHGTCKG
jgi:hypothetical protein